MMLNRFLSRMFVVLALMVLIPACAKAQQLDKGPELDETKDYYGLMKTSLGDIKIKFRTDNAPITVRNFVNLAEGTREFTDPKTNEKAKRPFYDGLIFHRVGPNFMIQGGDPLGNGQGGPGYKIPNEPNDKVKFDVGGKFAMANAGPNTGGSQFFITEGARTMLNQGYTIFGEVVEGTDGEEIVKKIARAEIGQFGPDGTGRPKVDVVIKSVKIVRVPKGTATAEVLKELGGSAAAPATEPEAAKPAAPKAEAPKAEEHKEGDGHDHSDHKHAPEKTEGNK